MIPDEDELDGPDDEIEVEEDAEDPGQSDDEGGDGSQGETEAEDGEAEEGLGEPERRQPSRATKAVQEAKRIAREASERSARLERELQELRAERAKPQGETPEQEAARLSLMTAEERMDHKLEKAVRENQRQMNALRFQAADQADKAAYDAKGAYDPRYAKYAPDVERLLLAERQAGRDFPRETILKFVLGERVMQSKKDIAAQKAAGAKRVQQQTARAGNAGSDRSAQRGRVGSGNSLADLEKRLEGVII